MKKLFLLALILCLSPFAKAQQIEGEDGELIHDIKVLTAKYQERDGTDAQMIPFEGECVSSQYMSFPKVILKFNKGLYNGSRVVKTYTKGKRVASINETDKSVIIQLPDENKVITYYPLLKKGYEQSYSDSNPAASTDTNGNQAKFMYTGKDVKYNGYDCRVYHAESVSTNNGSTTSTSGDIYLCTNFSLPGKQLFGGGAMPMKILFNTSAKVPMVGTLNTIMAFDTKSIKEYEVPESIFEVPSDIKIEKCSAKDISKMQAENVNMMKKQKLLPTQQKDEVSFNINEDWDF